MTFDKLSIEGDLPINKQNIIYFSCDPKYWAEYGQYLAKSTLHFNHHQVHVHVHLIYEQDEHNPKDYISDNFYQSVKNNIQTNYNNSIQSIIGNEIINNTSYEIYSQNIDRLFM